jgi:phosphatidylserine decarboxylase
LKQNHPVVQGERFSQIRFGSQIDLIIPLSTRWRFDLLQPTGCHVEAGIDKLVQVRTCEGEQQLQLPKLQRKVAKRQAHSLCQ